MKTLRTKKIELVDRPVKVKKGQKHYRTITMCGKDVCICLGKAFMDMEFDHYYICWDQETNEIEWACYPWNFQESL